MVNELFILLATLNVSTVHLTFDDGPNPVYTRQVLSVLKENKMKANFFLVGEMVNKYPEVTDEIVNQGHDIGGHSMSHHQMTKIPFDKAKKEIIDSMRLVNEYQATNLFRFPYGDFNAQLVKVVTDHGWKNIFWDVDTLDWKYKDANEIYRKFKIKVSRCKDGSLILMHDTHPQSVESLKMIVKYLKDNHIKVRKLNQ